jgi:hypothetical protein
MNTTTSGLDILNMDQNRISVPAATHVPSLPVESTAPAAEAVVEPAAEAVVEPAAEAVVEPEMVNTLDAPDVAASIPDVFTPSINMCTIAREAPEHLRDRKLASINLPSRAIKILSKVGVHTIADLAAADYPKLIDLQGFGLKCVKETKERLHTFITSNAIEVQSGLIEHSATIMHAIQYIFETLPDRHRDILMRRIGLINGRETLNDIAIDYQVSRERVRQIERDAILLVEANLEWVRCITAKIADLMKDPPQAISLLMVARIDPWFEGLATIPHAVYRLFDLLAPDIIHIVTIDDVIYFSRLDKKQWHQILGDANKAVFKQAKIGMTAAACRQIAIANLPNEVAEFADVLWNHVRSDLQFTNAEEGEPTLLAIGSNTRALVTAILNEAETPIHFKEINRLLSARKNASCDDRLTLFIASQVGLLFDRGTYGMTRHIPYTENEMDRLIRATELIAITKSAEKPQWHTEEVMETVIEQGVVPMDRMTSYILTMAMNRSDRVKYLGRGMWTLNDGSDEVERIQVTEIAEAILEEYGSPMTGSEILKLVRERRGGSRWLQIADAGRLVRIDSGLWGLNDRDIPIKARDQPSLLDHMESVLKIKGQDVFVNDIWDVFHIPLTVTKEVVFSLAGRDKRFYLSKGHWIGLVAGYGPHDLNKPEKDDIEQIIE